MHLPIFGHSFSELVAEILLFGLAFYFLNKKQGSARTNAKDADTGASGLITAPAVTNSGGSSSSLVETSDSASRSSLTETDNGASSSSTASTGKRYEVFLSFRGPDTRLSFTDHLYNGLLGAGIDVFRDDDELPEGKSIGPKLEEAIQNSKILIPILSVTYGESSWCLNELVRIMECNDKNGQIVLPIFYKVKPADVGHQIGKFGDKFLKREKRLLKRRSFDSTILGKWKQALLEVSNLKGYEADRSEGELVKSVVRKVLSELKKKFELVVSKNLVGIDPVVKEFMTVAKNYSHATHFFGIYGIGGIGKTTLAKVIYNKLSNQFDHRSYIADIRKSWKPNHEHHLQNKLIHDILKRENEVCDKQAGIDFISSRLKGKRVLILLDDVDNADQLNCLAGNHDWFKPGSKIIITTRNMDILKDGVYFSYGHKELDKDQSLTLFSKHTFQKDSPPPGEFKDLSYKVVSIIGGLPLSLEVVGSLLCGRQQRAFWEDTIKKLERAPPNKVQEILRISYEELDDKQKQIFLDIACFFIGTKKRIASYMWDACDFCPEEGIETLKSMSLIEIGISNELRMLNQLRDFGREIVREEDQRRPWRRSRLWQFEEVHKALTKKKGTEKIEAISLSKGCSKGSNKIAELDGYIYTEQQFKKLMNLRLLHLNGAHLSGDFEGSIEELKWIQWPNCPKETKVKNFRVKELAVLELSRSAIDEEWKGWCSFKMAEKLKFLDLSHCQSLKKTWFLSAFKKLEVLILCYCEQLQQIHSSIGDMKALRRLNLRDCRSLRGLPAEIGCLENLEILDISFSGIQELPEGIGRLKKLRKLHALRCREPRGEIPECLDFHHFNELQSLPNLPSSLIYLSVTCQSHELPSLSHLTHLKVLRVYNCRSLKRIQALPSELPESLNTPFKLETLKVFGCDSIETLDVSQFMNLRTLSVQDCSIRLEVRGLNKLRYLERLIVTECGVKRLDLPKSECLKILYACNCIDLVDLVALN